MSAVKHKSATLLKNIIEYSSQGAFKMVGHWKMVVVWTGNKKIRRKKWQHWLLFWSSVWALAWAKRFYGVVIFPLSLTMQQDINRYKSSAHILGGCYEWLLPLLLSYFLLGHTSNQNVAPFSRALVALYFDHHSIIVGKSSDACFSSTSV